MPLRDIQRALCDLYDLDVGADVDDFVCDAATVQHTAGAEDARGEVLVVAEEEDGVLVGLYVDPEALERLEVGLSAELSDAWLDDHLLSAACLATEGVSHFVYLMFRAENDDAVTLLELELQAEVDKYASALLDVLGEGALEGNGVGAIRARSRAVRERLFARVRFLDGADTEAGERYRTAHRLAARYAESLEERFLVEGDFRALLSELRRFYRRGLTGKLERVRAH